MKIQIKYIIMFTSKFQQYTTMSIKNGQFAFCMRAAPSSAPFPITSLCDADWLLMLMTANPSLALLSFLVLTSFSGGPASNVSLPFQH